MFAKYSTDVLIATRDRLRAGIDNAADVFAKKNDKSQYAVNSYHLIRALLTEVEIELYARGIR